MIRKLTVQDAPAIYGVVNAAAGVYKGVIPDDCYNIPYMSCEELDREMTGMTFYGWLEDGKLVGVMGWQPVKDVTLIRHAYVLPEYQNRGIGSALLNHLKKLTKTQRLLVGTWADATWAVNFYKKHGFTLRPDKDELLVKYWTVPLRQIETSVVLEFDV